MQAQSIEEKTLDPKADNRSERSDIDATTLTNKVLCGYQGWFRCPGDPLDSGWAHWSREENRIAPDTVTFEMWPDMSELTDEEKFSAPGFTYPDGSQSHLFSSAHPLTISRHFKWMRDYAIDGVLVQRFLLDSIEPIAAKPESARVLRHAAMAAGRSGRVFAVEYDMSGVPNEKLYQRITEDWKWLVDEMKITANPRYLHHDGLPVVGIWGFYPERFDGEIANQIIDAFKAAGPYQATIIGGTVAQWRDEKDRQWSRAFRKLDVISPWNVGNWAHNEQGELIAATDRWQADRQEANDHGRQLMPVIHPGFSWDNLKRKPPGTTICPRRGGKFFWEQFQVASDLKLKMVKVAMFDEVDEATAIFKVTNTPPTQAHFVTYEGKSSDWYLRLTASGSRLIRGEIPNTDSLPIPIPIP